MSDYHFAVITSVPNENEGGNLAIDADVFLSQGTFPNERVSRLAMLYPQLTLLLRTPVFHVGEILILDATGREVGWPGRKPSKWDVDVQEFTNLDEAVEMSLSLTRDRV